MTRPLRILIPDGIYNVGSRGIARQTIYRDDDDCEAFLSVLDEARVRFGWRVIAYCLMGNHYHALVQTPEPNLSAGMRDLNGLYATRFNRRHERDGSLLKAKFWNQLVQDNAYLLAAARYIALNPVRAGLVARPEDYRWSSYSDLHAGRWTDLVDPRPLLALFSGEDAVAQFIEVVEDGCNLPRYDPRKPIAGDADFVARHAPAEPPSRPVARAAWEQARTAIDDLFDRHPRDEAIRLARHEHRYTLREIAAAAGCCEETIRRRLKVLGVGTRPV